MENLKEVEEWRDIIGLEGKYQISSLGRIKSLSRTIVSKNGKERPFEGRIKKMQQKQGYNCVSLIVDGKKKKFFIHRLVAFAFIPNPENKPMINHIDFNRSNNNVKNLEWCTSKENYHHSFINGRGNNPTKGKFLSDHPHSVSVDVFEVYIKKVASFGSVTEAAQNMGVSLATIETQIHLKQKKINNLVFRLEDEIPLDIDEFMRWEK